METTAAYFYSTEYKTAWKNSFHITLKQLRSCVCTSLSNVLKFKSSCLLQSLPFVEDKKISIYFLAFLILKLRSNFYI